jgi:hypothetical protein
LSTRRSRKREYSICTVLRIHDILVWIRIRLFSSLTFKTPKLIEKKNSAFYFLKVHLHHFLKITS